MNHMKKKFIIIILVMVIILSLVTIFKNISNQKETSTKEIEKISLVNTDQWALLNKGQNIEGVNGIKNYDINAIEAWEISKGSADVLIGILDTGIDISNPKISKNIFVNKNEIEDNGIDDDGNGYVDDTNGWDFYNNDNSVYDDYLADYHGTFITSLIVGAHKKNNKVWGIAPNVKILPLKFMRGSSGNIDDAIKAIDYAYKLGVRIINCSWDNTNFDKDLYKVMKKYKDILFICSSGNARNNLETLPTYPCSFDLNNVVCVSATDNRGELYEFSGYGLSDLIEAPGKDILGMLPEGDYLYSDGTSFATAYVTGIAALVKSEFKNINSTELAKILKESHRIKNNDTEHPIIDAKIALERLSK